MSSLPSFLGFNKRAAPEEAKTGSEPRNASRSAASRMSTQPAVILSNSGSKGSGGGGTGGPGRGGTAIPQRSNAPSATYMAGGSTTSSTQTQKSLQSQSSTTALTTTTSLSSDGSDVHTRRHKSKARKPPPLNTDLELQTDKRCDSPASLGSSTTPSPPQPPPPPPPPVLKEPAAKEDSLDLVERLRNRLNQVLKDVAEKEKAIKGKDSEIQRLQIQADRQHDDIEDLERRLRRRDSTVQSLQGQATSASAEYTNLQRLSNSQEARIQQLEDTNSRIAQRIEDLLSETAQLEKENKALLKQKNDSRSGSKNLESGLQAKLEKAEREIAKRKKDSDDDWSAWDGYCSTHGQGSTFKDLKNTFFLEQNLASISEELKAKTTKQGELEQSLESISKELKAKTNQQGKLEQNLESVSKELKTMTSQHEELGARHQVLKAQHEELETLQKDLVAIDRKLEITVKKLNDERDTLSSQHEIKVQAIKAQVESWKSKHQRLVEWKYRQREMLENYQLHMSVMFDELRSGFQGPAESDYREEAVQTTERAGPAESVDTEETRRTPESEGARRTTERGIPTRTPEREGTVRTDERSQPMEEYSDTDSSDEASNVGDHEPVPAAEINNGRERRRY